MSGRVLDLKQRKAVTGTSALPSARLAKLVGVAADGVWIELEPGGAPVLARLCIDWESARLTQAVSQGCSAVLAFEDGDAARPLVLGIQGFSAPPATDFSIEADADGRRVRLTAQEELVLQCVDPSITLKRNGRAAIRGAYVETHASGTNRIKGGNVRIN